MTFQKREREREGRGGERAKRKEKRQITAAVRKVPIDQYMGVHDDSTPYSNCTQNLLWY